MVNDDDIMTIALIIVRVIIYCDDDTTKVFLADFSQSLWLALPQSLLMDTHQGD